METRSSVETTLLDESQLRLRTGLRRRGRHRSLSTAASILASTVAVAAVVAWLAFCREPPNTSRAARPVQRRLSDSEEQDEFHRILEGCLQLQEELGLPENAPEPDEPPERKKARLFLELAESAAAFERAREGNLQTLQAGTPGISHTHPTREQSKLVESSGPALVQLSREGTSGYEGMARLPGASLKGRPASRHRSKGSAYPFRASAVAGPSGAPMASSFLSHQESSALTGLHPQGVFGGNFQQGSHKEGAVDRAPPYVEGSPSKGSREPLASTSGDTSGTEPYGLLAESWIVEYGEEGSAEEREQGPRRAESPEDTAKRMRLAGPAARISAAHDPVFLGESSTSSGQDASGAATSVFRAGWQSAPEHAVRQQVQQAEALATEGPEPEIELIYVLDESQLSLSSVSPLKKLVAERRFTDEDIVRLHPFVRLPRPPSQKIKYVFDGKDALSSKLCGGAPMRNFLSMRLLFSQPSLTVGGAAQLMVDCKGLITYACRNLAGPLSKYNPYYVARRLASLLVVFDHIVCVIELLGDNMDTQSWWPQFVSLFETEYTFTPRKRAQCLTIDLAELAERSSALLNIYKKGIRPPLRDIIEIKRKIYSSLGGNSIFDHPLWEAWLRDDDAFTRIGARLKK